MSDATVLSARKPFLRTPLGRATLVIGAFAALGVGVASARGWGQQGGYGGRMGGGFERFCAVDAGYVTQRMADAVTMRLNLTEPQKASLADLRQTALGVATEAKKLCATKPDMTTTPGRLAAMQARLTMAGTAMTALKPKIEAFYATLDDAQKKQFDAMGPGARMRGHGPMGGRMGWGGQGPMQGMGGMQGMGMGGMGMGRGMGGMPMQGMGGMGMGGMGGMAPRQ